ncbi:MAG: SRPBCC domain-containing protein [Bacteroidota bacterium]
MKEIRTEIVIEAPRNRVWQLLTEFAVYPNWNPFIREIEGQLVVGTQLRTVMQLGEKPQTFRPVVTEVVPEKRFAWLGKLPLGSFSGQHYFELESRVEGRTKLIHGEYFSGWLRGPIMNRIGEATRNAFIEMNRALKAEAEQISAGANG